VADDRTDELYGLALEDFVAARDALAKELRAGGDREAAAEVKRLAKPSAAAWAVNQAVRSQPNSARALWKAGDELAAVQTRLLGGDADADDLRRAARAERAAVEQLVDAARGLLSAGGHTMSETTLERVEETLHAAALDREARTDVAAGRATKEVRHVGLGGLAATTATPARPGGAATRGAGRPAASPPARRAKRGAAARATPAREPQAVPGDAKAARRAVEKARAAVEHARQTLNARQDEADEARERAETARGEAEAARGEAEAARREAEAARERAEAARRDADTAARAAEAAGEREQGAQAALDDAEGALRRARGR
jgi:hypothetical protein